MRSLLHHAYSPSVPKRLNAPADYLTALGFRFQVFDHDDLRLAIRLDWAVLAFMESNPP